MKNTTTITATLMAMLFALASAPALAGDGRLFASGAGQGTSADFVTYLGTDGVLRDVGSISTTDNQFSFGFTAMKHPKGGVEGQMQLTAHVTGMSINSDVEILETHDLHGPPVGELGPSVRMKSSTDSVEVNGEPKPGWRFVNSPSFEGGPGGGDTVCFEITALAHRELDDFVFGIAIHTPRGVECWGTNTDLDGLVPVRLAAGSTTVKIECANLRLGPGEYLNIFPTKRVPR